MAKWVPWTKAWEKSRQERSDWIEKIREDFRDYLHKEINDLPTIADRDDTNAEPKIEEPSRIQSLVERLDICFNDDDKKKYYNDKIFQADKNDLEITRSLAQKMQPSPRVSTDRKNGNVRYRERGEENSSPILNKKSNGYEVDIKGIIRLAIKNEKPMVIAIPVLDTNGKLKSKKESDYQYINVAADGTLTAWHLDLKKSAGKSQIANKQALIDEILKGKIKAQVTEEIEREKNAASVNIVFGQNNGDAESISGKSTRSGRSNESNESVKKPAVKRREDTAAEKKFNEGRKDHAKMEKRETALETPTTKAKQPVRKAPAPRDIAASKVGKPHAAVAHEPGDDWSSHIPFSGRTVPWDNIQMDYHEYDPSSTVSSSTKPSAAFPAKRPTSPPTRGPETPKTAVSTTKPGVKSPAVISQPAQPATTVPSQSHSDNLPKRAENFFVKKDQAFKAPAPAATKPQQPSQSPQAKPPQVVQPSSTTAIAHPPSTPPQPPKDVVVTVTPANL